MTNDPKDRQLADRRAVAGLLDAPDRSLVDLVDSLLDKGVVLDGELLLGLADVDLIYVRLAAIVAAADKVLPPDQVRSRKRRHQAK